jgi:hypothetical protein
MWRAKIMIVGLIVTLTFIALIFLLIRRLVVAKQRRRELGEEVRSFFQYSLLFGLLIVVTSGLSGILARIFEPAKPLIDNELQLARDTAFLIVGIPIFIGLIYWAKKSYQNDPGEKEDFAFTTYFALATLFSLALTLNKGYDFLTGIFSEDGFNGAKLAVFLTWSVSLGIHYQLTRRLIAPHFSRAQFLLASLITLVISMIGLAKLIRTAIAPLFPHLNKDALLIGTDPSLRGAALLLVAAPLWYLFWIRTQIKNERSSSWHFYLLIGGIGGGLATAVISSSMLFYQTLIWFFGDPGSQISAIHFSGAPMAIGAFSVGLISFFYHRAILKNRRGETRNEIVRIYQYILSGIGLILSSLAILLLIVATIEILTESSTLYGSQSINMILASVTLLLVGGPLWLITWHQIGVEYQLNKEMEASSRTRRVYLFALFGVSAIAAIISLLTIFVRLFEALFGTGLNGATTREMAYSIGILFTTAVIAGYHFKILRADRSLAISQLKGPRYLLLIGPEDSSIKKEVEKLTGGVVDVLNRRENIENTWSLEEIENLIGVNREESQVIILDEKGARSISIER